jgi:hypothetical protein
MFFLEDRPPHIYTGTLVAVTQVVTQALNSLDQTVKSCCSYTGSKSLVIHISSSKSLAMLKQCHDMEPVLAIIPHLARFGQLSTPSKRWLIIIHLENYQDFK